MKDKNFAISNNGVHACIDPESRIIALRLYDGIIKIINLNSSNRQLTASTQRIEEIQVLDMIFLYTALKPTIALLYEDQHVRTKVVAYTFCQHIFCHRVVIFLHITFQWMVDMKWPQLKGLFVRVMLMGMQFCWFQFQIPRLACWLLVMIQSPTMIVKIQQPFHPKCLYLTVSTVSVHWIKRAFCVAIHRVQFSYLYWIMMKPGRLIHEWNLSCSTLDIPLFQIACHI